jgi:hypothetical protein
VNEAKSLLPAIFMFHQRYVKALRNIIATQVLGAIGSVALAILGVLLKVFEQPKDAVAGDGWLLFRMYYGPEFIGEALAAWAKRHEVELRFIQPGKSMQNGYIERFNRSYRTEVLNCYVFEPWARCAR